MNNYLRSGFLASAAMLAVAFTIGCASSGGGEAGGPIGNDSGAGSVEMQVWNRSDQTLTVFARWGNAPRLRLGNLSGGRRGSFVAYIQGPRVAISWDVLSGRPPASTGAGFFPAVADGPGEPQCGVDVQAGDRIEWTIGINSRSCSYVRMEPAGFN
jgi:hypothetical protein